MLFPISRDGWDDELTSGDDLVIIQANNTRVDGALGNDWLTASHLAEETESLSATLIGNRGDDTLLAAMTLDGEGGITPDNLGSVNLRMLGGRGNDEIEATVGTPHANQTITVDGGAGSDKITINSLFYYSGIWQDADTHDAAVNVDGGTGNDRIDVFVSTGDATLHGGDGADTIRVGGDRLALYGDAGADLIELTTAAIEATLNGGTGNDTLIGADGDDTLIGLNGNDRLTGNGGADVFLFGYIRSGERDTITDFVIGEDVIDLSMIDANRDRNGDQSWTFGTREGTGRVWIEQANRGSSSVLHADDGHRELIVVLQDGRDIGPRDYHASDFLL